MRRQSAFWLTIGLLFLSSLACNAFSGNLEPAPLPPTAVSTFPTTDFIATVTLPGETAEPQVEMLIDLNIRSGPGVQYDRLGYLLAGKTVPVEGVDPASGWWKISCPVDVEGPQCWVSGGEQYTRAANSAAVPVVAAPPTPTPPAPELEPDTGVLVYIDNGRLYAAKLDLQTNPPTPTEPQLLVEDQNIQRLYISPNGLRVAYIAGNSQANSLNVVNINGQDKRTLVSAEATPFLVGQVQWFADSLALAFNTDTEFSAQVDLWTVTLDGELMQRFAAGEGGGAFLLLPDGQVLLSRQDNITRANLDGTDVDLIIPFEAINTASEYIYYPQPQQTTGGGAYVAIPDAQAWQDGSGATLWQIPADDPVVKMKHIEGNILFDPVLWSRNGRYLTYIQRLMETTNPPPQLVMADGNGQNAQASGFFAEKIHTWSPDNQQFIYSGPEFYAIGQVDSTPIQVSLGSGRIVGDAQWSTENSYILALGFVGSNSWELQSVSVGGTAVPLTTLNSNSTVQFAVWAPY